MTNKYSKQLMKHDFFPLHNSSTKTVQNNFPLCETGIIILLESHGIKFLQIWFSKQRMAAFILGA